VTAVEFSPAPGTVVTIRHEEPRCLVLDPRGHWAGIDVSHQFCVPVTFVCAADPELSQVPRLVPTSDLHVVTAADDEPTITV
jgi:hypothetical protein